MIIIINGMVAALKEKSTFEFISENRYFSGADSYSLAITFPLKDCPQNIAIFGHITRKDVEKGTLLFECELRDKSFYKKGSITVTELDDVQVKTQFLEGKSATNFASSFDDVYINELELGYPDTTPANNPVNTVNHRTDYVALPWVNNSSGNIQNKINLSSSGATWNCDKLSFQPYMIWLVKKMCQVLNFTYDFTPWENSNYKYLLICNTLPAAWNMTNFARALPHWTMTEFLEELELLMNCEFDIDRLQRKVTFRFSRHVIESCGVTQLQHVLNDYEMVTQDAGDCKYKGCTNLKYADCSHRMWKYYHNPEFIKFWTNLGTSLYKEYDEVSELSLAGINGNYQEREAERVFVGAISRLWYCRDIDRYVIGRVTNTVKLYESEVEGEPITYFKYYVAPQIVNSFEPRIVSEGGDTKELKIVPVWLDDTQPLKGQIIFLEMPDLRNEKAQKPHNGFSDWTEAMAHLRPEPDYCINEAELAAEDQEFLDKIYVGFWSGESIYGVYRHPHIDVVTFYPDWTYIRHDWSLSLNSSTFGEFSEPHKIDPTKKYTFKFLADDIPNVRSLFIIFGKRYVCEKITATFTENGMSQLLKGTFYPVLDE